MTLPGALSVMKPGRIFIFLGDSGAIVLQGLWPGSGFKGTWDAAWLFLDDVTRAVPRLAAGASQP